MRKAIAAGLIGVLLAGACQKAPVESRPSAGRDPNPAMVTTTGTAEPGMCAEHGVLEAVCTKCNPKLIPVFQAKGDWCAEHGLPESICPVCHPERSGKPAADVSADAAPADGTKIRFKTKDTAKIAGLKTVTAVEQPSVSDVMAVARIVYDATRVAQVNARAPGVVRALHADVGTRVRRGTPLAQIESATVGADQSRLATARVRTAVAEAAYRRTQELSQRGIVPANDLLLADQELQAARAEEAATVKALHLVGPQGDDATYTLVAPLAGIVTQRHSTVGTLVDIEEMLFEIVDPSFLWAEIDIPEGDLGAVAVGQHVVLSFDGVPDREVQGTIDYIAPALDPRTRTAMARARVGNPDGVLRANMYGRARILTGEPRHSVVVPRAAVQRAMGMPLVFVRLADDVYETRRVRIGLTHDGQVELVDGVRAGESVVTEGSFLLKTETLKGSIGAGCCDPVAGK